MTLPWAGRDDIPDGWPEEIPGLNALVYLSLEKLDLPEDWCAPEVLALVRWAYDYGIRIGRAEVASDWEAERIE